MAAPGPSTRTSNARKIAGGVFGDLAALTLLVGLIWVFLRHKREVDQRTADSKPQQPPEKYDEHLSDSYNMISELSEPNRLHELQGKREISNVHEMDGWRPQEIGSMKLAD